MKLYIEEHYSSSSIVERDYEALISSINKMELGDGSNTTLTAQVSTGARHSCFFAQ